MEKIPVVHHLIPGNIDHLTTPANKLHFPTRRHFYYALLRTLHKGSDATTTYSARRPLPLELIAQILRDAECTVLSQLSRHAGEPIDKGHEISLRGIAPQLLPAPDPAESGWPLPLVNGNDIDFWTKTGDICNVDTADADLAWEDWFSTAPLSAHDLANMQSIQLLTLSRDQGWVSDPNGGSWSWFDIVLLPSEREEEVDTEEPSWLSHTNGPPISPLQIRAGSILGHSHAIWQSAQIGDRIGVRACARFSGWENVAITALLILQEYFIPSFVPR